MAAYLERPSQTVVYFGEQEGGPTVWSAWTLSSHFFRISHRGAPGARPGEGVDVQRNCLTGQNCLVGPGGFRRALVGALAVGLAFTAMAVVELRSAPVASAAATAPAAAQCNPADGYPTTAPAGAGQEVSCDISVVNSVSPAGATSSTITSTTCLAAAGVLPPAGCTTAVVGSTQLVSTINQCNGIIVGGGSNLTCNVTFTNDVSTGTSTTGATVNQCIGSGTGGGIDPTFVCAPVGSTTNATVTQCNGSGNGGGASMRVKCTVTGADSALPASINQCNGSSNGGGSTVTCTTTIVNNFVPLSTTGTTPTGGTSGPGSSGTPGVSPVIPATPGGSGLTGLAGSSGGAGSATGQRTNLGATGIVPTGAPQTGFGGASLARDDRLVFAGILALIGAGLALTVGIVRRRPSSNPESQETA